MYYSVYEKNKYIVRRIICVIICVALFFGILTPLMGLFVSAEGTISYLGSGITGDKAVKSNLFMLNMGTGTIQGKRVDTFFFEYTDTNGVHHSEAVFPKTGKWDAVALAKAESTAVSCGVEGNTSTFISKTFLGTKLELNNNYPAFLSNENDYILIQPLFQVKTVDAIKFYCEYSTDVSTYKNEWSCQHLQLIRVDRMYGMASVGATNYKTVPLFSGEVLYRLSSGQAFTWTDECIFTLLPNGQDDISKRTYGLKAVDEKENAFNNKNGSLYIFEMDIADIAGAGLEELSNSCTLTDLTKSYEYEYLLLNVKYKNAQGEQFTANIPIVASFVSQLLYANKNKAYLSATTPIDGIFRQGDTIAFHCVLPDCKSIESYSLRYTTTESYYTSVFNTYKPNNYCNKGDDSFVYSAIRVYDGTTNQIGFYYDGETVATKLSESANPVKICMATSDAGFALKKNELNANTVNMQDYIRGDKLHYVYSGSIYVFSIQTDNSDLAQTKDEVSVTFDYTRLSSGLDVTTETMSLSSLVNNYYGYWESYTDAYAENSKKKKLHYMYNGNYTYLYSLSANHTVYFAVKLNDVQSINGMSLTLLGDDVWQICNISVYHATSAGKRTVKWEATTALKGECSIAFDELTFNKNGCRTDSLRNSIYTDSQSLASTTATKDVKSDRIIEIENDTMIQVAQFKELVLLTKDVKQEISFETGTMDSKEANVLEYPNYMSYEETKQNFGFTKARYKYLVAVQVGNELNPGAENGDCGSANQFYFQLVFADGKSGYVLANQQLSSDGFRTGAKEKFYISMNNDYGDLAAIHIIPVNPNSEDDNFDKLKIETIEVTKEGLSSVSLSWTFEIHQWISIDYSDPGAKDTVTGQAGKTEAEMARFFTVSTRGYKANLMVAISTDAYGSSKQLSGNIQMNVSYVDTLGVTRAETFDITKAMYTYAEQMEKEAITVDNKSYIPNDQTFMMRANHVDRFVISIPEITKINFVSFTSHSNDNFTWNISAVRIYTIDEEGRRILNAAGEYVNTGKTSLLCESTNVESVKLALTTQDVHTATTSNINLSEHSIDVSYFLNEVVTNINTYPDNKEDTLNVYVYMTSSSDPVSEYDMTAGVVYTDSSTSELKQKSIKLNADTANKVFYRTGISVPGVDTIPMVKLAADAYYTTQARISKVVVEHVRSGVIVRMLTLYVGVVDNAAFENCVATYSETNQPASTGKQILTFMIDDSTGNIKLENKQDDLAISLTYTSSQGGKNHTLTTANKFISDTGVVRLIGGRTYSVEFDQENIVSVDSVNFVGLGTVVGKVMIKNAIVKDYTVDEERNLTFNNWYNFAGTIQSVANVTRSLKKTDDYSNVAELEIKVKTLADSDSETYGTSLPIRMVVSYLNKEGNTRSTTYEDLNDYIISGSTSSNDSIRAKVLINTIESISSISFEPIASSVDQKALWGIEDISLKYTTKDGTKTIDRSVKAIATEGNPVTVSTIDIGMEIITFSYDEKTNISKSRTYVSGTVDETVIELYARNTMKLTPRLINSAESVSCVCYKVGEEQSIEFNSAIKITGTLSTVRSATFDVSGITDPEGDYTIVFTLNEAIPFSISINIRVVKEET